MYSRPISRLSEPARRVVPDEPNLIAHLPYVVELDDETVCTRRNGLMMSLEIGGIDGLTAAPQDIVDLRRAFTSVIDGLDERFTLDRKAHV